MSKLAYSKKLSIVSIIVIAIIAVLFLPIVPYSYKVQVPYQTTEQQQVPYQQLVQRNASVLTLSAYTLQPNHSVDTSSALSAGMDVSVSWSADDTVSVKVFNSDQYNLYASNTGSPQPIVSKDNVASGTLGFHVSAGGTYYFVIYNPHTGFIGIGSHNVGIYNARGTATWQEMVTLYRTETVMVTKLRTDTKNVSLSIFQMLTGQLPTT